MNRKWVLIGALLGGRDQLVKPGFLGDLNEIDVAQIRDSLQKIEPFVVCEKVSEMTAAVLNVVTKKRIMRPFTHIVELCCKCSRQFRAGMTTGEIAVQAGMKVLLLRLNVVQGNLSISNLLRRVKTI